jgi:hypothetical protein
VIQVLEETGDYLLQHPFNSEEATAMASMGARATAKYAILRLERDTAAIMEAIWRLERIVDENEAELAEVRSQIAQEIELRKYFESLAAKLNGVYTTIDSEKQVLNEMRGMQDEATDMEDSASRKPSWRDRARDAQQGNFGMKWKYAAKQSKLKTPWEVRITRVLPTQVVRIPTVQMPRPLGFNPTKPTLSIKAINVMGLWHKIASRWLHTVGL